MNIICTEDLVKFGGVVLRYASRQTDRETNRQTYRHVDHNTSQ